jgi:hypothetical protein
MGGDGVFPAEMPDEPSQAIVPLDADTAERLLSGRLDPDDAPPGYAEVARLLQAAAAPADQAELAGQAAAMDTFRRIRRRAAESPVRPVQSPVRPGGARRRLVTLALAGVVAAAGLGVWTAGGAPFPPALRSPSGGPSAATAGSGAPGSGAAGSGAPGSGGSGAGAAGSLRPARAGLGSASGSGTVRSGRRLAVPSDRERATARHGGGVTSRAGGPAQGDKPRPGRPAKRKPPKASPEHPSPEGPSPGRRRPEASQARATSRPGLKIGW